LFGSAITPITVSDGAPKDVNPGKSASRAQCAIDLCDAPIEITMQQKRAADPLDLFVA
jgi:hypothetical protein